MDTSAEVRQSDSMHGEQVPNRLSHLQADLRRLLNEWDPIGVYDKAMDFPPDEYECMEGPLLARLHAGADEKQIDDFLNSELIGHFGLGPGRDNGAFARRLVEWFRTAE